MRLKELATQRAVLTDWKAAMGDAQFSSGTMFKSTVDLNLITCRLGHRLYLRRYSHLDGYIDIMVRDLQRLLKIAKLIE